MKKILFLPFVALLLSAGSNNSAFICNSPNAKKYHLSKSCRGLNSCKHEIKEVTMTHAKENYTLCGWED